MAVIHTGDCLDVMPTLGTESVDAIVTDPPYGIRFMGKAWDGAAIVEQAERRSRQKQPPDKYGRERSRPRVSLAEAAGSYDFSLGANRAYQAWSEAWAREAFRVARPSAYLLAFGGTRTVHRLATAIEDAGWIIRDLLVWAYASGFPKSKASLKPAWEPIVMARKPGPLRMLAIDECRIPMSDDDAETIRAAGGFMQAGWDKPVTGIYGTNSAEHPMPTIDAKPSPLGRWPANVILTDPIFDGDVPGVVGGGETAIAPPYRITAEHAERAAFPVSGNGPLYGDSGTYSRFFLVPKADRADREPVVAVAQPAEHRTVNPAVAGASPARHPTRANVHPTVKPTELMRHLVRLITPPGGLVLDPFLGSGTTAIACELEGFRWVGIEREPEYVAIAEARLNGTQRGMGLVG